MKPLKDDLVEFCILHAPNAHDRQAFRNARRLARHLRISFHDLLLRETAGIVAGVADYRNNVGAALPAAFVETDRLAGAILRAAQRVRAAYPHAGVPDVAPPELDWLRPLPRNEIETFAGQVDRWTPPYRDKPETTGTGKSMTRRTASEYRAAANKLPTLLQLGGLPIGPSTDLEAAIDPESVAIWLPELQKHYAPGGMASFSVALKRICTDLLGKEHLAVVALRTTFRGIRPGDRGISAAEVELARDLGSGATGPTVWSVPDLIDARSNAPMLSIPDRDSRKSCSLASHLVIRRLLVPRELVRIHLKDSVQVIDGVTKLIFNVDEKIITIPLREELIQHFRGVICYREHHGITNMWLFRGHGDGPQGVTAAMADLARNLQAVLNRRQTAMALRNAVMINLADRHPSQIEAVADAARISTVQWIETKLRIPLEKPLSRSERK